MSQGATDKILLWARKNLAQVRTVTLKTRAVFK